MGELSKLGIVRRNRETTNVDKSGEGYGNDQVGGEYRDIVLVDERPDWKIYSLGDGAGSKNGNDGYGGRES